MATFTKETSYEMMYILMRRCTLSKMSVAWLIIHGSEEFETGDLRCNQIQGMKVAGEFKKTFSSR